MTWGPSKFWLAGEPGWKESAITTGTRYPKSLSLGQENGVDQYSTFALQKLEQSRISIARKSPTLDSGWDDLSLRSPQPCARAAGKWLAYCCDDRGFLGNMNSHNIWVQSIMHNCDQKWSKSLAASAGAVCGEEERKFWDIFCISLHLFRQNLSFL